MSLQEEVTLVIPAYGRPEFTRRLLSSLVASRAKYPIIVVDDASPVPVAEIASAFNNLNVTCIRSSKRTGPAVGRNLGINLAKTQYVAFTDNDVTVAEGWMENLYSHISSAPPIVAGVGGRVLDDGRNLVGRYSTRLGILNPYIHKGRVLYVVTANCIFRRNAVLRIGGFDEKFRVPGGEDPELSFRLLKAGYRLEYNPNAIVYHSYTASWIAFYSTFYRYGHGCKQAMLSLLSE